MPFKVSKKEFQKWVKKKPSKATVKYRIRKGAKKAIESYEDSVWRGKVKEAAVYS